MSSKNSSPNGDKRSERQKRCSWCSHCLRMCWWSSPNTTRFQTKTGRRENSPSMTISSSLIQMARTIATASLMSLRNLGEMLVKRRCSRRRLSLEVASNPWMTKSRHLQRETRIVFKTSIHLPTVTPMSIETHQPAITNVDARPQTNEELPTPAMKTTATSNSRKNMRCPRARTSRWLTRLPWHSLRHHLSIQREDRRITHWQLQTKSKCCSKSNPALKIKKMVEVQTIKVEIFS